MRSYSVFILLGMFISVRCYIKSVQRFGEKSILTGSFIHNRIKCGELVRNI